MASSQLSKPHMHIYRAAPIQTTCTRNHLPEGYHHQQHCIRADQHICPAHCRGRAHVAYESGMYVRKREDRAIGRGLELSVDATLTACE